MNQPSATAPPLMYDLDDASLEEWAKTNARLKEVLLKISQTTSKNSGNAPQDMPLKSHGLLRADVEVLDGLPSILVQGIFANPGTYHAVMRFSSVVSDMVDGNVSTPHGLDIKLLGVDGGKLEESEGTLFQDIVLMNGPAFVTSDTNHILGSLRLLAANGNKAPNLKKMLSSVLKDTENNIAAAGDNNPSMKAMAARLETNVLAETYYSRIPMLYGPYMAKVSITPVSPELLQLKDSPVYLNRRIEGLREAVIEFFSCHYAVWELRVQLCTDPDTVPIEDASIVWPEEQSPFITIARITAKPQRACSDNRLIAMDNSISSCPIHA